MHGTTRFTGSPATGHSDRRSSSSFVSKSRTTCGCSAAILRLLAPLYAIGAAIFAVYAAAEHENLLLGFVIFIAAALGVIQIMATAEAVELLLSLDRRVERGWAG